VRGRQGGYVAAEPVLRIAAALGRSSAMGKQAAVALYVLAMAALVVGVDVLIFRNHFWQRLTANVGIVLVFAAFYFRFLQHR
jgi:hypothetical protein